MKRHHGRSVTEAVSATLKLKLLTQKQTMTITHMFRLRRC